MLKEGICIFSGLEVKKGSGLIKVMNDARSFLFINRKVRSLVERKANPRSVDWTQPSRIYKKKGAKKLVKKEKKIQVLKEIRGYPAAPTKVKEEKKEEKTKKEKYLKNIKIEKKKVTKKDGKIPRAN